MSSVVDFEKLNENDSKYIDYFFNEYFKNKKSIINKSKFFYVKENDNSESLYQDLMRKKVIAIEASDPEEAIVLELALSVIFENNCENIIFAADDMGEGDVSIKDLFKFIIKSGLDYLENFPKLQKPTDEEIVFEYVNEQSNKELAIDTKEGMSFNKSDIMKLLKTQLSDNLPDRVEEIFSVKD